MQTHIAICRRRRYPGHEARHPWLTRLLNAYHISDTATRADLERETLRRGAAPACRSGCSVCCVGQVIPVSAFEIMPGVLALLEQAQPGALAKLNEERSVEKTLGFFYWRQALAASWFREAFGGDGRRLMLEMPDGTRRDASRGVQAFSANRLTVDVDAGGAGAALYYADAWHPAWRAFVDGREAAVRLSRGAFKAVAVPPGRHDPRATNIACVTRSPHDSIKNIQPKQQVS